MEKNFIKFINNSHTTFQAVDEAKKMLDEAGFIELDFINKWNLVKGSNYYIIKSDGSIIAFKLGKNIASPSIHIVASHNDSPMFKIKPNGMIYGAGYSKLNSEVYGGPIYSTWLDRPLGIAGRVIVKENDALVSKNITLDTCAIIPNLAIHMNREINSGYAYNPQSDLQAVLGLGNVTLLELIEKECNIKDVVDYDLFLYNKEEARVLGANKEFISGPRLDNLECMYTSLVSLIETNNDENINICACFNHEEIGSNSNHGAASTLLIDIINQILSELDLSSERLNILNRTMVVSADNAHALHPNRPDKSDPTNNVKINSGVVIKYNAGLSYTSDAISASIFKAICNDANVPYQEYTNRSDVRGGGTLGSILLRSLSVISVDIGLAQLAMHSSYETAGVQDLYYMKDALSKFYGAHISFENTKKIKINA